MIRALFKGSVGRTRVTQYLIATTFVSGVVLAAGGASGAERTALGVTASSMTAGTWRELQTEGLTPELLQVHNGVYMANILEYQNSGVWDPNSRQVLFVGGPHNPDTCRGKFIAYSEVENRWRQEKDPSPDYIHCTHSYDHNTINAEAGELYFRPYNKPEIWKYMISTKKWSKLSDIPQREYNCCGAIEYFPERRGILFVGTSEMAFYKVERDSWSVPSGRVKTGPYHSTAEYSPVDKVLIFGGGSGVTSVYRMDTKGQVTRRTDSPYPLDSGGHSIFTADPVSGRFLLFGENGTFYEYDAGKDRWQLLNQRPPFFDAGEHGPVEGSIAIPIATYGVVMVLTYSPRGPKVFLYRHGSGPGQGPTGD